MCGGGQTAPAQTAPSQPKAPPSEREAKGASIQDSQRDARRRAASGRNSTVLTGLQGAGDPTVSKASLGA
jgi:hypothetical protein